MSIAHCLLIEAILCNKSPPLLSSANGISPYPISTSKTSTLSNSVTSSTSVAIAAASSTAASSDAASSLSFFSLLFKVIPIPTQPPPNAKNDNVGNPGIIPKINKTTPVIIIAFGIAVNCWPAKLATLSSLSALVTKIPAAVDIRSAGIWLTSPSPIVNLIYVWAAVAKSILSIITPIIIPAKIFTTVTIIPAMASPLTNFEAPSIEP